MLKNFYSVYDAKSKFFGAPFTSINDDTAIREFSAAASDSTSMIHKYPTDYCLFFLGSFCDESGSVTPVTPVNLGLAAQFISEVKK